MTTVIYVHGTGVREADYRQGLETLTAHLEPLAKTVRVSGLYWGGTLGTQLHFRGASIPHYGSTRAAGVTSLAASPPMPDPAAAEEVLWDSLDRDPLFEFRLLGKPAGPLAPNAESLEPALFLALREPLDETQAGRELLKLLEQSGLLAAFHQARTLVGGAELVRRALLVESPERTITLARAVVATLLALDPISDSTAVLDALDRLASAPEERNRWVLLLAKHLNGENRGPLAFVKGAWDAVVAGVVAGGAALASPWIIRRRRRSITDLGSPAVGDILWYQARGAVLRRLLRTEIARFATDGPVVLAAHSLGGIACVDTLLEKPEPAVKLLIMAGSQAPYFYEIGALTCRPLPQHTEPPELSRPLPHELPKEFPAWLNFFDPQDLLGYWAAPVFGNKATDHELDNGLRFPAAHSGYWRNPALWDIAIPRIASL